MRKSDYIIESDLNALHPHPLAAPPGPPELPRRSDRKRTRENESDSESEQDAVAQPKENDGDETEYSEEEVFQVRSSRARGRQELIPEEELYISSRSKAKELTVEEKEMKEQKRKQAAEQRKINAQLKDEALKLKVLRRLLYKTESTRGRKAAEITTIRKVRTFKLCGDGIAKAPEAALSGLTRYTYPIDGGHVSVEDFLSKNPSSEKIVHGKHVYDIVNSQKQITQDEEGVYDLRSKSCNITVNIPSSSFVRK